MISRKASSDGRDFSCFSPAWIWSETESILTSIPHCLGNPSLKQEFFKPRTLGTPRLRSSFWDHCKSLLSFFFSVWEEITHEWSYFIGSFHFLTVTENNPCLIASFSLNVQYMPKTFRSWEFCWYLPGFDGWPHSLKMPTTKTFLPVQPKRAFYRSLIILVVKSFKDSEIILLGSCWNISL